MNLLSKQTNADPVSAKGIVNITGGINSKNYELRDRNGDKVNNDPLNNASEFANKPASSIPTVFARVLFFNSALLNIDNVSSTQITTYNKAVSQWLDLLELIFRRGAKLKYVEWKINEQLEILKEDGKRNPKHKLLAEALEDHANTYLPGVESVYLIFNEENKLMGGTSPYTFVYTSPNYKSNLPVKSLLEREEDFQEFVVRLYLMLKGKINADTETKKQFSGFVEYMEAVLRTRKIREKFPSSAHGTSEYSYSTFCQKYETARLGSNPITIAYLPGLELNLYMRKEGALETDFYMDSDLQEFNPIDTPLVLPVSDRNGYGTLILHDNVLWRTSYKVPQDESVSYDTKRELPDGSGIEHRWISEINLLEDKLVQLPYLVDENKFFGAFNVPTDRPDGSSVSYLLPIKPVLMRFFSIEKLKSMVQFKKESDRSFKVTLKVPVRNLSGRSTGEVVFEKTYTLAASLYPISASPALKNVLSIGISPFMRLSDNKNATALNDRYDVMLQASNLSDNQDIDLEFITSGNGPLSGNEAVSFDRYTEKSSNVKRFARFYEVKKPFDGIEVKVKDNGHQIGGGIIIPIWDKRTDDGQKMYMYSIDFGTTNTHIAYITYNDGESKTIDTEKSFKSEEIDIQAQYLAALPVQSRPEFEKSPSIRMKNFLNYVYGKNLGKVALEDQARLFFPNYIPEEYAEANRSFTSPISFPIRTVVTKKERVGDGDSIYKQISIGFYISKEVSKRVSEKYGYERELKWNLEKNIGVGEHRTVAKLFFTELLQMVRNHWIQQKGADLSKMPRFIITFPLAMTNVPGIMNIWKEAYQTVFNVVPERNTFTTVAESLAPAYKLIGEGAVQSAGILNVDIGGGTTDLQYYSNYGGKIVSRYDSVRFAGDDLWGGGYENVVPEHAKNSVFTRFADDRLAGIELQINQGETTKYEDIEYDGKEKINVLLRDMGNAFGVALTDSKETPAFKAMQLHYAALIYYITNWIKSDVGGMAETFPRTINFSGFGSKYIPLLFGNDLTSNEKLTDYTKALFKAFGATDVPSNLKVQFSDNPKDVTAEGAALYAIKGIKKEDTPKSMSHLGYDGFTKGQHITWANLGDKDFQAKAHKHFADFLEKFQNVETELSPLPQALAKRLLRHAQDSFNQMYTFNKPKNDEDGLGFVRESLFFWMLKGSIHKLDQD